MEKNLVDINKITNMLKGKLEYKKNNLNLTELGLITKFTSTVDMYVNDWESYTNLNDYRVNTTKDDLEEIINSYKPDITSLINSFIDDTCLVLLLTFYENGDWLKSSVINEIESTIKNIVAVDFRSYVINALSKKEKEFIEKIKNNQNED